MDRTFEELKALNLRGTNDLVYVIEKNLIK
jgi:hypothetical protein